MTEPATMSAYAARKRELIGSLTGTVVEIGAGTGANFAMLRSDVRWVGVEPAHRRRARLRRRLERRGAGELVEGRAESLPLPDNCADAVLSTIVLCSVADQTSALAEVVRVLRPNGRFVFFEHVAAPQGTRSARVLRTWAPVSRRVDHGCDPTRRTAEAIGRSPLERTRIEWYEQRTLGLRVPFIAGIAYAPEH